MSENLRVTVSPHRRDDGRTVARTFYVKRIGLMGLAELFTMLQKVRARAKELAPEYRLISFTLPDVRVPAWMPYDEVTWTRAALDRIMTEEA